MAEEQFDFVFHTGDYIYEGRADGGRSDRVRQHNGDRIYTLVDYRNRYALYKADRDLMAAHASAPWVMSWDDHEVDNNYAGDFDERDTPPELFLLRRAAAYQAYYETMPLRASALPSGNHMRMYRRLQFGNLIDLSVLDTRQWRSRSGVRRRRVERLCRGARAGAHDDGRRAGTVVVRQPRHGESEMDRVGQQVTRSRTIAKARSRRPFFDGQMGRLRAARQRLLRAPAGNEGAESDRPLRRCASPFRRRSEDGLHEPAIGDGRRRVHELVGDDDRRWQRGRPDWESTKGDNPHVRYHSNRRGYIACTATPARDASRLQDPRPALRCPICRCAPAARSSSKPDGRGAIPTSC